MQAAVVRWLAENGTTVGVIGDSEQAIYGFVDASPTHFVQFQLPGFRTYSIVGNRRSTSAIVTFLNGIRTDGLIQTPIETETGSPATVYSGNLFECLMHARSASQHSGTMLVLARKHKNVVRARRPDLVKAAATWDIVDGADPDRSRFLMALAASTDLARRGLFDLAVQRLVQAISSRKHFRSPIKCDKEVNIELRRGVSLSFLEFMVTQHELFITKSTLEVYAALVEYAKLCLDGFSLRKAVKGKFYEEAAKCPYSDLVHGLRTTDETRLTRTIHQAKGSEAESVFIVLDDGEADHILNPQADNEEHRITYVGLSRAKSELFIFCPEQEKLAAFATRELVTIVKGASHVAKVRTRATHQTR